MKESYIKSLYAKNVGLFEELKIKFNKHNNFIVGPNATGKTSILRCIALAINPNSALFSRYGDLPELWIDIKHREKNYRIGMGKGWVKNQKQYRSAKLQHFQLPPSEKNIIPLTQLSLHRNEIDFCPLFIGAYRRIDYVKLDGMKREGTPVEKRRLYRDQSTINLEGISLPNVKQWMINRYFSIDKEWAEIERENWEWLNKNFSKIAPNDIDFAFVEIKRDLEPVFSVNGLHCYLEELSAGFQAILSLIFCIFDWIEGIYDYEADRLIRNASGTVVIDELDIHMHPEWQFTIGDTLNSIFPNLQFITTTHSPHLIASAKSNEIIILPQFSRTIDVIPTSKIYSGWTTDQILADIMGVKSLDNKMYNKLLSEALDCITKKDIDKLKEIISELEKFTHPTDIIVEQLRIKLASLLTSV